MRAVFPASPAFFRKGGAVKAGDEERLFRLDSRVELGVDGRSARKNVTNCFFKR